MLYMLEEESLWGWMAVLGRFISSFVFIGTTKAYGVLIPYLVEQLEASEGSIGLCGSLFAGLPHIAGMVTTPLVNRYGVRKIVMLGGTITVLGLLCASICTNVLQLGIFLAISGYSNGLCIIACIMPLTWHFPDKFALVNSISASGGAIGMMILPPLTEVLVQLYGWRGTVMMLAALNSLCVLSGAIIKESKHKYYLKKDINDNTDSTNDSHPEKCSKLNNLLYAIDGNIFKMFPSFVSFQLIFLSFGITFSAWMLFLVPSSLDKGISSKDAAFLSTIGGVGNVLGRIIQGPLIKCGIMTDLQLFGIMSLSCAICFTSDQCLSVYLTYALSAFVVGFATGVQYTLSLTMTKRLITNKDLLLAAMGWTHIFIGCGKMLGGTLVGYLFDSTGKYTAAFLALGGLEVLSIIVIIHLEFKHCFKSI